MLTRSSPMIVTEFMLILGFLTWSTVKPKTNITTDMMSITAVMMPQQMVRLRKPWCCLLSSMDNSSSTVSGGRGGLIAGARGFSWSSSLMSFFFFFSFIWWNVLICGWGGSHLYW
ncbi:hypothetical protein Hanom_Chr13g01219361 [Helianthus anomalus]